MKRKLGAELKLRRAKHPLGIESPDEFNCCYVIGRMFVIVSNGGGWDHVSVSLLDSDDTPTWEDMCHIKNTFFEPEECVIQYHPPESAYVNRSHKCLHLWRPQGERIPTPSIEMV